MAMSEAKIDMGIISNTITIEARFDKVDSDTQALFWNLKKLLDTEQSGVLAYKKVLRQLEELCTPAGIQPIPCGSHPAVNLGVITRYCHVYSKYAYNTAIHIEHYNNGQIGPVGEVQSEIPMSWCWQNVRKTNSMPWDGENGEYWQDYIDHQILVMEWVMEAWRIYLMNPLSD
ncbi:hypothetical protein [Absidia glauca]|uniref:Uncharacterized protein n=1 Tax=Absidia glauca TaxID=4829 RepID=A0A168PHW7_ABSGL|nr:hypothetical protein [Absidia glauca]